MDAEGGPATRLPPGSLAVAAGLEPEFRTMQLYSVASTRAVAGDTEAAIPPLCELIDLERARSRVRRLVAGWIRNRDEAIEELLALAR